MLCHVTFKFDYNLFAKMKRTAQALDWIIKSMVEKGSGMKEGPPALEDIDRKKQESNKGSFIIINT